MSTHKKKNIEYGKFPKRVFVTTSGKYKDDIYLACHPTIEEADDNMHSPYKDIQKIAEYKLVGKPFTVKHTYKVIRRES